MAVIEGADIGGAGIIPRSALDVAKAKIIKAKNEISDTHCTALNSCMSNLSEIIPSLSSIWQTGGGDEIINRLNEIIENVETETTNLIKSIDLLGTATTSITYTEENHTKVISVERISDSQ